MGVLVNLAEWKRRKDEEAHQREIEEIRTLRAEVAAYLDELGGVETGPYISEEERDSWARRSIEVLMPVLNSYTSWPIDSSDM